MSHMQRRLRLLPKRQESGCQHTGDGSHLIKLTTLDGLQAGAWDWQLLAIAELPADNGIGPSVAFQRVVRLSRAKSLEGC